MDLDAYVRYCESCSADYVVALDVIPGTPGRKEGLTKREVEDACRSGWDNYKRMVKVLPRDRVVPVYHQNDPIRWLERYLDAGVTYVGISPANDVTPTQRMRWLDGVRERIPKGVRTHGFGVSSPDMMRRFPWHSVDSTTWVKHAQVWQFLVPYTKGGKWDYLRTPMPVQVSPRSRGGFDQLTPTLKATVRRYLAEQSMAEGAYTLIPGTDRREGDVWLDGNKQRAIRTVEDGVKTNPDLRMLLNMRFFRESSKLCGVADFYFSGLSYVPGWLGELPGLLLSFAGIPRGWREWLKRRG